MMWVNINQAAQQSNLILMKSNNINAAANDFILNEIKQSCVGVIQ